MTFYYSKFFKDFILFLSFFDYISTYSSFFLLFSNFICEYYFGVFIISIYTIFIICN